METAPWPPPPGKVLAGSVTPNFSKGKTNLSSKSKGLKPKTKVSKSKSRSSPVLSDRFIYTFWDGSRTRKIDPMEVQNTLNTIPDFDLDLDFKMATAELIPDKEKAKALQRVISAIRKAFGIEPYCDSPESGLTGGECMSVFVDFAQFIDELKKRLGILQTSSQSAVPQGDPSPTKSNVDSLATGPGSSQLNPLFMQQAQPSSSEESSPESGPTL